MDPGTTVGLAIIDFDGNVIHVESKKEWPLDKVITRINEYGAPQVVATDKANPPYFVKRLSSNFGSILFYPEEDIPMNFKRQIARRYKITDPHQRDALAAALFAFKRMRPRILKAREQIREREDALIGQFLRSGIIETGQHNRVENHDELKALKKDLEKTKRQLKELKGRLKSRVPTNKKSAVKKSEVAKKDLENKIKKLKKELEANELEIEKIKRLLEDFMHGEIEMFYKSVPSRYRTIYKIGNIYFARERNRKPGLDMEKLEEILADYRKTKMKELKLSTQEQQ